MKPWFRAAAVIAVLAPVAGCSFYFGDDTGDDCTAYPTDPGPGYRNPDTGTCDYWGGGGCGDVPLAGDYADESGAAAQPDWATCAGPCEALDELSCLAAAECRAAYTGTYCSPAADCTTPTDHVFLGCWGIAPSGPATGEACWDLDAYSCSRHNDCAAIYNYDAAAPAGDRAGISANLAFQGCEPEPALQMCLSDDQCPDGYVCTAGTECLPPPPCNPDGTCDAPTPPVCYGQCVPSTNSCDAVDCGLGYHCEEQCWPCDDADGDGICPPFCQPQCVPDYDTCAAVDCGPGYECQELCYPCDPLPDGTGCEMGPYCEPQCVPITPPTCDAVDCGPDSHCEIQCYPGPPTDPAGPPTMDECYPVCVPNNPTSCGAVDCAPGTHCEETCTAGPCTPDSCPPPVCDTQCVPDPTNTCESLTTEADCTARADCVPVYTGDNCTCYPWGCTCDNLTYERCETGLIVDPATGVSTPSPRVVVRRP